jgi:peroxiredoxin
VRWRGTSTDTALQPIKPGTLAEKLLEIKAGIAQYVRPENQAVNDRVIAELRKRGIGNQVLPVGADAPAFELADQHGSLVRSQELLAKGKLIINFYRGRWCPFCMTELEAWREALPQIEAAGASLVAISPQLQRHGAFTADQHKLRFPVLSDVGNQVARAFGIVYDVPEEQKALYKAVFVNLEHLNGMKYEEWSLPLPTTYVIGQDGRVDYAFASADYMDRAEPAEVLAAVSVSSCSSKNP